MSPSSDVILQMNNWENCGRSSWPPTLPLDVDAPDANVLQRDPHGTSHTTASHWWLLTQLRVTEAYWELWWEGLHIPPHTQYTSLTSREAIRVSFAASPQAYPSIIWWHLMICASKCGLDACFGRWPLTNHLHDGCNRATPTVHDKQESSDDDRCPHIVVEWAEMNAGCDVVMAAVVSVILLKRAKSSF